MSYFNFVNSIIAIKSCAVHDFNSIFHYCICIEIRNVSRSLYRSKDRNSNLPYRPSVDPCHTDVRTNVEVGDRYIYRLFIFAQRCIVLHWNDTGNLKPNTIQPFNHGHKLTDNFYFLWKCPVQIFLSREMYTLKLPTITITLELELNHVQ